MSDKRKSVGIRADLLNQARDLNIDVSQVSERVLSTKSANNDPKLSARKWSAR